MEQQQSRPAPAATGDVLECGGGAKRRHRFSARLPWTLGIGSFLVLSSWNLDLHATQPRLNSTTPPGAQRGTEIEVKLNGSRLDDAQELIFYRPGIEMLKLDVKTNTVKARLRIAKDCVLGEHQLRVRTATGVSDLKTFYVGPFPTVDEVEPNDESGKAQKIAPNNTVQGVVADEDVDSFVIQAKRGDRISAEIEAMRLGRSAFDPYLAIFDSKGTLLAKADDTALLMQDAFLSIMAPKDGAYTIQVRETSYGGNSQFAYRLHLGTFPRPTGVYPAGGQTGERLIVRFVGDPLGEFAQTIKLPAAPDERFGAFANSGGIESPSPNWIRVSAFPNVLESGDNQSPQSATSAVTESEESAPIALNGIISKSGEADWFRFKAKKGKALDVSVFARRLRSPLDSLLEVRDKDGNTIASNDDSGGPDSSLKFTPDADGEYFVVVKDQLRHGGPDFVYRVEITPVESSLSLSIPQVARNDSQTRQYIVVPRGNRFATLMSAKRANFNGELTFSMDGLPVGVKMLADKLPEKANALPIVFEAASDAPVAGKLLDLIATSANDKQTVTGHFKHDVELVEGPNNTFYYGTDVEKLYVAVTKEIPFKIRITETKVPLLQSGNLDLKVVAERSSGFTEAISLKMVWNPPGVNTVTDINIPKEKNSVTIPLSAKSDAETRQWKIAVLGSATVGGGTVWASTQLAPLDVAPPMLLGKIDTLNVSPGQSAKLVCKLEQKESFDGKASVKLMGLPDKVTTSDLEITHDSKEASFDLTIDPKASLGSQKGLFCRVTFKRGAEEFTQDIAKGGVLRLVPAKKTETKVASK